MEEPIPSRGREVVCGVDPLGFVELERASDSSLLFDATASGDEARYVVIGNYACGEPFFYTRVRFYDDLQDALDAFLRD